MRLHLGAHLSWYVPQRRCDVEVDVPQPTPLAAVLGGLGVPAGEVALAVVNGELVSLADACVRNGDRVFVCPPIGAG
jgi:sulfur carrier protein ThiS